MCLTPPQILLTKACHMAKGGVVTYNPFIGKGGRSEKLRTIIQSTTSALLVTNIKLFPIST